MNLVYMCVHVYYKLYTLYIKYTHIYETIINEERVHEFKDSKDKYMGWTEEERWKQKNIIPKK